MKRSILLYTIYFIAFACLITVFGCQDKTDLPPTDDDTTTPVTDDSDTPITNDLSAKENYRNHCGGCHGQQLESFIEREWSYGNTPEDLVNSIQHGYTQNGMPAYNTMFSKNELDSLVDYILTGIEGKTLESLEAENPNLSGTISSENLNFRLETITSDINGIPWGMVQLPNGEFLVTERGGKLYKVTEDKPVVEISGLPNIVSQTQGGLLDIVLHPNFSNNAYVYVSYSKANPNNTSQKTTAVARAKLSGNTLIDTEDIFIALPYINSGYHYGSRLLFDNDGYLYISVGDRGANDIYPQALDNHHGKVHRIQDNGQIPTTNPFVNNQDAVSSIFSYGIRNPQGLTLHPVTGDIWEGEHGPQGGDEINILSGGNNYGWPVITYGIDYDGSIISNDTEMPGMEQPVHYWTPSIAPCGMTFLSSEYYKNWKNDLFVSSLKFEYLHRLKMDGNVVVGHEELLNDIGRVRDVYMGNDSYLYILVEGPGRLIRLVPEQ